jgi:hypothetical protein
MAILLDSMAPISRDEAMLREQTWRGCCAMSLDDDPELKLGLSIDIPIRAAAPTKLARWTGAAVGHLFRPVLVVAGTRLCARLAISESIA